MVSQHRHQVFLTLAKVDNGYIDYLTKQENVQLKELSFLKLYCFGPFNIFNSRHVFTLGRIALALTVQLSLDR